MKLLSTGLVLGLATMVAAQSDSDSDSETTAGPHYWDGASASDIAPIGCAKPTGFFNCYKPVSKYKFCDGDDDGCNCSSVAIELDCFNKNCGTDIEFNSHDSSLYCRGTATIPASIASPTAPANTEAIPTSSPATTPAPTAATASPAPASTSSKPNAGERSVTVSAGGLVAVLAAAVGSLFY